MSSPHPPADMTTLLAFEAGQRDAVARIVAWLRRLRAKQIARHPDDPNCPLVMEVLVVAADAIERGAHEETRGGE